MGGGSNGRITMLRWSSVIDGPVSRAGVNLGRGIVINTGSRWRHGLMIKMNRIAWLIIIIMLNKLGMTAIVHWLVGISDKIISMGTETTVLSTIT